MSHRHWARCPNGAKNSLRNTCWLGALTVISHLSYVSLLALPTTVVKKIHFDRPSNRALGEETSGPDSRDMMTHLLYYISHNPLSNAFLIDSCFSLLLITEIIKASSL
ncbi:hypothetical protein PO909_009108 [Leuciscus waleckii]